MTKTAAQYQPVPRAGTPDDAIDAMVPKEIVRPGSTTELTETLREATEGRKAMAILGNRSKINWGHPPDRFDLGIETAGLDYFVQHDASDLVVRASANVTLEALQAELDTRNQRLSVDVMVPGTTIGGLIATGISGPLRYGFGAVRDLVIGITVVRADGVLAASGGRVVKNVAGYDLAKLYTGSYGTLGVVTEAFFRLHSLPEETTYLLADLALSDAQEIFAELVHSQVAPSAIELSFASDANEVTVAILIEGMARGIATRSATIAALLRTDTQHVATAPPWWGGLPGTTTFKVATEISSVVPLLESFRQIADETRHRLNVTGSAGAGVLFVGTDIADDASALEIEILGRKIRDVAIASGGSCIVLRAPAYVRASLDVWGPVPAIAVMRRVKAQFDPWNLLAPGRFVGGI